MCGSQPRIRRRLHPNSPRCTLPAGSRRSTRPARRDTARVVATRSHPAAGVVASPPPSHRSSSDPKTSGRPLAPGSVDRQCAEECPVMVGFPASPRAGEVLEHPLPQMSASTFRWIVERPPTRRLACFRGQRRVTVCLERERHTECRHRPTIRADPGDRIHQRRGGRVRHTGDGRSSTHGCGRRRAPTPTRRAHRDRRRRPPRGEPARHLRSVSPLRRADATRPDRRCPSVPTSGRGCGRRCSSWLIVRATGHQRSPEACMCRASALPSTAHSLS